jgi:APA family basic amino acid/polyamine antiporter
MTAMTENHTDDGPTRVDDSFQVVGREMPAEFGLPMASFVVVASMIGVGVLTTSGYTMALVGSNQYMLALWVVGGVIAICGALTLAELSAALPHTGGDYVYLYHAFGPLAAFLSGWVSFLIGFSGPCAASAFASAKYILAPIALESSHTTMIERLLATVGILAFALLHVSGRERTARVQGWITGLKLLVLLLLIVAGLAVGWPHRANLHDAVPVDGRLVTTMMFSLVYIYYAYTGWNGASYLAGEIRNPQQILPRAILFGTAAVMLLYLGANTFYALALSAGDVQAIVKAPGNEQGLEVVAPIAEIASRRLFGPAWSGPLSIAIGLMMLSTLSAYLLLGPRVLYAMARAGQFPAVAARLTPGAGTPAVATTLQVAMAVVLLWTGTFENIVVYASVGLSIFSMLAMSSIFVLRWKRPDLRRPFRTPGYPVTPALYLALTAVLACAAFWERPKVSCAALASILAGIPFYYLWKARQPSPATNSTQGV